MQNDKDFDLYLGGNDLPGALDDEQLNANNEGTPDVQQAVNALGDQPVDGTAPIEEPVEAPAEEPATETPAEPAEPVADTTESGVSGEASADDLMKMIESLNTVSDQGADANAEIKQVAEEIKTAAPESDDVLAGKIDELIQKLADKEANELKLQKTIDVLKSEYEKTLNDKISLEFGTASDSRIAQIVNEDPDVKALIAAKMATGDNAQDKVMEAWKTGWENVSGSNISDLVGGQKNAEVDALSAMGEDSSNELGSTSEEDMYI